MGFPENISQGETAMQSPRCGSSRQVTFGRTKRSFVMTKVQLACLTKPATQSDMLPDTFCTKIIVGKRIAKKWATQFFDKAVCTNRSPESPMCLGYLVGWFTGQM